MALIIAVPNELTKLDFNKHDTLDKYDNYLNVLLPKFRENLKEYCQLNSSCPHAGKMIVLYTEENSDSSSYYGAEYFILDYETLIHIDGEYGCSVPDELTSPLNKQSIIDLIEKALRQEAEFSF